MPQSEINVIVFSIILFVLLLLSMFFSGIDMAFGCVNLTHLESYYKEKKKMSTKLVIKFVKHYDQTISAILLANDLTNIGITIITILFAQSLNEFMFGSSSAYFALITTLTSIVSLVLLLFIGEVLPKSIGKIMNFKICHLSIYPLVGLYYLFFPVTFVVKYFIKLITFPFRKAEDSKFGDEELHEMVDEIEEEGVVDEEKAEMLRGTIDYANTEAYEVMTPRVDVYAIDIDDDLEEILDNEETYIHSRIPVYQDSIDNVIGFVMSKTLVRMKLEKSNVTIKDVLFPILKFPRSTEINDIFREFKAKKIHFGVILDEYGGTEGILTMEDILEEIVGEIWDEEDDVEAPYYEQKDGSYIVDGGMNLFDFFDLFELDKEELEDTMYVTIAGFCIELLDDHFAKVGDKMHYKNIDLEVISIDKNNTIGKLLVHENKEEE